MRKGKLPCIITDCERPHHCHGLCLMHYKRVRKTGDPFTKLIKPPGKRLTETCSVPGCGRRYQCRGFCTMHYSRFLKHGDPNVCLVRKKGEGTITRDGYRRFQVNGKLIREHRKTMEEILGRALAPDEVVHHINGDRLDNRPGNLQVMTNAQHVLLHWEERRKRS